MSQLDRRLDCFSGYGCSGSDNFKPFRHVQLNVGRGSRLDVTCVPKEKWFGCRRLNTGHVESTYYIQRLHWNGIRVLNLDFDQLLRLFCIGQDVIHGFSFSISLSITIL